MYNLQQKCEHRMSNTPLAWYYRIVSPICALSPDGTRSLTARAQMSWKLVIDWRMASINRFITSTSTAVIAVTHHKVRENYDKAIFYCSFSSSLCNFIVIITSITYIYFTSLRRNVMANDWATMGESSRDRKIFL